jgi:hypothetical protein
MRIPLKPSRTPGRWNLVLWTLTVIYASSRFLRVFPGGIPMLAIVVLHVVPPALLALTHGARIYRLRYGYYFTKGVFALLAWIKRPGGGAGSNATGQPGLAAKEITLG